MTGNHTKQLPRLVYLAHVREEAILITTVTGGSQNPEPEVYINEEINDSSP